MTIVDVFLQHATQRADRTAYMFLRDDGHEDTRTFGQLAQRVRAIAADLQAVTSAGDRAILLFQPGIDFVEAILGCFVARVVARRACDDGLGDHHPAGARLNLGGPAQVARVSGCTFATKGLSGATCLPMPNSVASSHCPSNVPNSRSQMMKTPPRFLPRSFG